METKYNVPRYIWPREPLLKFGQDFLSKEWLDIYLNK